MIKKAIPISRSSSMESPLLPAMGDGGLGAGGGGGFGFLGGSLGLIWRGG